MASAGDFQGKQWTLSCLDENSRIKFFFNGRGLTKKDEHALKVVETCFNSLQPKHSAWFEKNVHDVAKFGSGFNAENFDEFSRVQGVRK